jgi:hypothetical protein
MKIGSEEFDPELLQPRLLPKLAAVALIGWYRSGGVRAARKGLA